MTAQMRRFISGNLLLLLIVSPLMAQDANQLYEFKFKDPKNDGWFNTLQEKLLRGLYRAAHSSKTVRCDSQCQVIQPADSHLAISAIA